ncbi:hypothetical protein D3C81_990100 [compost metagenome]
MRRASTSKPRALSERRLAACISCWRAAMLLPPAMSPAAASAWRATAWRSSKPSSISDSKRVPRYICASICSWRASNGVRPLPLSETLGTPRGPASTMGRPSVKATGAAWPPSACARRLRKPLPRSTPGWLRSSPAPGRPASMVSWVSKWLRDKSCVPANGTNASCPRCHSGSMAGASAGCSAQSPMPRAALSAAKAGASATAAPGSGSAPAAGGRRIAILGRAA